jgi:hypothetical protein
MPNNAQTAADNARLAGERRSQLPPKWKGYHPKWRRFRQLKSFEERPVLKADWLRRATVNAPAGVERALLIPHGSGAKNGSTIGCAYPVCAAEAMETATGNS